MECVTAVRQYPVMELILNLAAGLTGLLFAIVGIYSVAAIWMDDLP